MPVDFRTELMPYLNEVHQHHYSKSYKPTINIAKSDLFDYVRNIYNKLAKINKPDETPSFPAAIGNGDKNLLDRYAYNLVLNRACIAEKNQIERASGGMDYLNYAASSDNPKEKAKCIHETYTQVTLF